MPIKRILLWSVASVLLLAFQPPVASQPQRAFVDGEILIQFRGAGIAAQDDARRRVGARRKQLLRRAEHGDLEIAVVPRGSVVAAIAALQRDASIEFAEPNWVVDHQDAPDDPFFTDGQLWGLYGDLSSPANPFGSRAAEVWAGGERGSSGVFIGIIDEGIDITHPDLAANIWTNPFDPIDGIDNDGNGYVDDHRGWDFVGNDNTVYDGVQDDHGTHVAGTIGAAGGNGLGVVGVNWNVTIIPAKFLGVGGGSTANAIRALDYLVDLKQRHGLNIVASNNSWGGGGYSSALHAAIIRAAKAGILFVAAAGNQGIDIDTWPFYPAAYRTTVGAGGETAASFDSVISVAALTDAGSRASFSSYGATSVDLAAPGSGIYSTLPGGGYGSSSGTSMAAPHVTGGVALYMSMVPAASAADARRAILNSAAATPTSSMAGITVTGGRLNLAALFAPAVTTNLVVTSVSNPPAVALLKERFTVSDTVQNVGVTAAGGSETAYFLSADPLSGGDKKFGPSRLVLTLLPGESSAGAKKLTIPANTPVGSYFLIACADGDHVVAEEDESDNCRASSSKVDVRAANLITGALTGVSTAARATTFVVSDSASNVGNAVADASTTRYYLSVLPTKVKGGAQLTGSRLLPVLGVGLSHAGATTVGVPADVAPGSYFLLACTDALKKVAESDEKDNCRAAATAISITP